MEEYNTLDQIDEEIHALERRLLDLKRQRNSMLNICRLPKELLVLIICNLQIQTKRLDEPKSRKPISSVHYYFFDFKNHDLGWLRMTSVCKHIRDVAVNTPQLWMWVQWNPSHWNEMTVSRSENASLYIHSLGSLRQEYGIAETAHNFLSEAGHARLHIEFINIERVILQAPPSRLTVLHLISPDKADTVADTVIRILSKQLVEFALYNTPSKLGLPSSGPNFNACI
jgi:hypothetical protein